MYRMLIIGATVAVAATVAAAALGQGNGATATKLEGTVGPNYTISLTKAGKKVKTLKPGTYTITVKLVKGHWKYYCSLHEPQMYGWLWVR